MFEDLNSVIEAAINNNLEAEAVLQNAAANRKDVTYLYLRDLAKKELRNRICEEIKEELKEQIVKEAQDEIDRKANLKQIQEIKTLTVTGAILAVFIGLLVNQLTEIISYYKGSILVVGTQSTWLISTVFFAIAAIITAGWFFRNALKIIKDFSEKKS